ncbi:hypothetical protein PISMIDRAFT_678508 [Pisolithus microcarpus 441]|uniref:Unplaced genomic scaffold scaffold_36, whole genome shotgun sequence n=1 Tax=Pisolithus microcarpus 441 TaxID=765257 RepID=A0A0C9ZWM5_9AGAM|nr:hypothetical protein BKA83DRAFT_678508 [Pisolithus microcarpus]KIK24028.1 hypothetical protein PISMIDRAFT_678508 [Pisolithus microcarpus 441]
MDLSVSAPAELHATSTTWQLYHEIACCEASYRLQKDRLALMCDTYVSFHSPLQLTQPPASNSPLRILLLRL